MSAKFGLSSWGDKVSSFNNDKQERKERGPQIPFFKVKEGPNVVRLITEPYKYYSVKFKLSEDDRGFGTTVKCSEDLKNCPTRQAGFKAKPGWYAGIIDRTDGQVKIIDMKSSIYGDVNGLNDDVEWGDPQNYDVTIKRNSKNPPASYYGVTPRGKASLSEADQKLVAASIENLRGTLERLSAPPPAEKVLAKMKELGWDGTSVLVTPAAPKTKNGGPELAATKEEDYSFEAPSAE